VAIELKRKYDYRQKLPHLQGNDRPLLLDFNTQNRRVLPPKARDVVLACIQQAHPKTLAVEIAVVMPEHVHIIGWPLRGEDGFPVSIPEFMKALKSSAAHMVNRELKRKGKVWQRESFDYVLRKDESLEKKIEYVRQNPVRRGLVKRPRDYPWLWEPELPVV
jgi:REP element-mobilizing transposase RayT